MSDLPNPTISTYWNLAGLLAWYLSRDPQEAQYWNDKGASGAVVSLVVPPDYLFAELNCPAPTDDCSEEGELRTPEIKIILDEVLSALMHGSLKSKAIVQTGGPRVDLMPNDWVGRCFIFSLDKGDLAVDRQYVAQERFSWSNLLFSSLDARKLWPSPTSSALEVLKENGAETEQPESHYVFKEHGNGFKITFEGNVIWLKRSVGLRYIKYLLMHPNTEILAEDLRKIINPPSLDSIGHEMSMMSQSDLEEQDLSVEGWDVESTKLDAKAKSQIESEVSKLQREFECAREVGDAEGQTAAQDKLLELKKYLSAGTDIHGNLRKDNSASENNRKAIQRAISKTRDEIGQHDQALAEHLRSTIQTGTWLKYSPPAEISWNLTETQSSPAS